MKLPENLPEDVRDWPVSDMLELGLKNTKWEEKHYPSGMAGALLLFEYSEERVFQSIGQEDTGVNPQMYFIAGLDLHEAIALLDKVKNRLMLELIRHEIKHN